MVFLVVTRAGYDELLRICNHFPSPLWVACEVLSESELGALHASGANVSVFDRTINPKDSAAIEDALYTIAQHHPNQRVWVERASDV